MPHDHFDTKNYLKSLSDIDFQALGTGHIAYIREIDFLGQKRFVVYGADGEQISIREELDHALSEIETHDMEPATLQ